MTVSWRSFPPEFPVKSADFSENLPLKISRNFDFFSAKYQKPCLKVNSWIMPDQKKELRSLRVYMYMFTGTMNPEVFTNKLGNSIINLFAQTLPRACFLVADMPTWLWDLSYNLEQTCTKVSLLQFTQTLLRACFILLLTYTKNCTKLITVYGLAKLITDFIQNSILIYFNLFPIMDPV